METLSAILLIGCLILIVVAIATRVAKPQDYQEHATTTTARLEFEAAEKELAAAKMLLQIVNNTTNPRPDIRTRAQDNFEMATEEWLFKLKKVLQLRKRARSPSPETIQLYARFTSCSEIVTE